MMKYLPGDTSEPFLRNYERTISRNVYFLQKKKLYCYMKTAQEQFWMFPY